MLEPPLLVTFAVAQVFGLLAVIFIIMAAVEDNNNTVVSPLVDNAIPRFVWHPVLMSIGLVYLFGCSAVIYRVLRFMEKLHAKIIHAGIHFTALVLALVGLTFAIQFKTALNFQHFSSIHGLFGLITVILFATQWLISIPVFLWPKAPDKIRAPGMAVHICLGIAVFLSAAVTTFTGLNSKSPATKTSEAYYKTSAFFYIFYVFVIFFMVTLKEYKRPPDY
ncbi:hypothetical protein GE061_006208 [Apolygus lucorum]|uniref:Cytochrome b561 domain-containing protein n=1 Tax=Apolygus lucorum TaxID=248454 RepID=A0A8S9WSJ7_APOLU|nr:hypothetical protein GE061_006208 [Apolygus lucorum]